MLGAFASALGGASSQKHEPRSVVLLWTSSLDDSECGPRRRVQLSSVLAWKGAKTRSPWSAIRRSGGGRSGEPRSPRILGWPPAGLEHPDRSHTPVANWPSIFARPVPVHGTPGRWWYLIASGSNNECPSRVRQLESGWRAWDLRTRTDQPGKPVWTRPRADRAHTAAGCSTPDLRPNTIRRRFRPVGSRAGVRRWP